MTLTMPFDLTLHEMQILSTCCTVGEEQSSRHCPWTCRWGGRSVTQVIPLIVWKETQLQIWALSGITTGVPMETEIT